MFYSALAKRARYFKEDEIGVSKLSEITQELIDEGEMKGKISMIIKMLRAKQTLDFIAQMSDFTIEKIRAYKFCALSFSQGSDREGCTYSTDHH